MTHFIIRNVCFSFNVVYCHELLCRVFSSRVWCDSFAAVPPHMCSKVRLVRQRPPTIASLWETKPPEAIAVPNSTGALGQTLWTRLESTEEQRRPQCGLHLLWASGMELEQPRAPGFYRPMVQTFPEENWEESNTRTLEQSMAPRWRSEPQS